ncbi:hypothetical protein [Teichococcus oryzae]|uniref:Outer membrane protein assembly factor BamE n=1 Tax=Teichococcus oryzae TaxID=1608942 RepID=A0A5B2TII6_9PROT|nr:hypothetical protein [Pseudoroseomonas oryzae]KAA2213914.1 hypothetical protein F0Q34_07650 [Pseudoroseomonas oryzae]
MPPRALILAFSLLLGACAQQQQVDPQAVLEQVLASYRTSLAGMQPVSAPATPPLQSTPGAVSRLVGQSPDTLRRWLGEPVLRRKEGNAQIWLYQASFCHLDVVFDRDDVPNSPLRVSYAAARSSGTDRQTEASCLQELQRGAATAPGLAAARPGLG